MLAQKLALRNTFPIKCQSYKASHKLWSKLLDHYFHSIAQWIPDLAFAVCLSVLFFIQCNIIRGNKNNSIVDETFEGIIRYL